jgi:hypothetical protein
MAKQVQFRRGSTSQHSTFTGAVGEITVDTDKDVAVVHDGSTAGGFPLARQLSDLGVTATSTELNYVDGVTSAIQTQLDAKVESLSDLSITATSTELNYVDGVTSAIQTQLDAKVGSSYTGDVDITGELIVDSYNETYGAVTSSSNATTVDCEAGNAFSHTLTENTTFTFSNPPASGTAYSFSLEIIQDASASGFVVTWPSSVDWPSATAPTLTATASAKDVFVFYTRDGGTTFYGFTAGQALA